jgi:hypothetical protein
MDDALVNAMTGYRERLAQLCFTEPIAMRLYDMARTIGLGESDTAVLVAVHALECLKATQKELETALMELPPDAFYIRDEDGTRKLVRYIGPTIQELRAEHAKGKETPVQPDPEGFCI